MNDDFKITFDWSNIKDMYTDAGSDISPMIMSDNSMYTTIQCNPNVDAICATSTTVSSCTEEINELKKRLDDIEKANDYMRTDCKAIAEGLARREDKIKELEAENKELKLKIEDTNTALENERHINDVLLAQIEYCKKNGVWADKPAAICSNLISRDKERGDK